MKPEKTIIIGSDDAGNLAAILNCIRNNPHYGLNILSASRLTDTLNILRSCAPDLVLCNFKDNQEALNCLTPYTKKPAVPVLCLDSKNLTTILDWNIDCIVFVYPLEMIYNKHYLINKINSIFLLKSNTPVRPVETLLQGGNIAEMGRYVVELDRKKDVLLKIKDRIKAIYPNVNDPIRNELISIVNLIKATANDKKLWDDFKFYFEHAHQGFLKKLTQKHPGLTPIDLKYCCYLKMNMSNDDIKRILGINQESVRTHTYRLKLKMALPKDEDLRYYLRSVS